MSGPVTGWLGTEVGMLSVAVMVMMMMMVIMTMMMMMIMWSFLGRRLTY